MYTYKLGVMTQMDMEAIPFLLPIAIAAFLVARKHILSVLAVGLFAIISGATLYILLDRDILANAPWPLG
ncbi:MAG TPA: hypothetical protein VKV04_02580, partial [Verrucomicrobiae bacterium]|nr:hypothetical protein [Verrucomicrobiae bacterium]